MFAYRLALQLGYPHPDHLLEQLTGEQFNGWRNYYEHEPWGEVRADARSLFTSNRVVAAWGGKLPYRERTEFERCVLDQYREPELTVEEAREIMERIMEKRARKQ